MRELGAGGGQDDFARELLVDAATIEQLRASKREATADRLAKLLQGRESIKLDTNMDVELEDLDELVVLLAENEQDGNGTLDKHIVSPARLPPT